MWQQTDEKTLATGGHYRSIGVMNSLTKNDGILYLLQ